MAKHNVAFSYDIRAEIDIEAETWGEAVAKVEKMLEEGTITEQTLEHKHREWFVLPF